MKPQSAKNKGRHLQKWVRDLILEVNPELKNDDVQSRSMGAQGEDVMLSPAARVWVPFQIECKNKDHVAVYAWYGQAREHGNHEPLLVIKENFAEPLVIVDAALFFQLLRRVKELGKVQNQTS